jgi:predicted nucleic acid-binding protein
LFAACLKADHALGLGDAFLIATARAKEAAIVAGADEDLEVARGLGIEVQRVRTLA